MSKELTALKEHFKKNCTVPIITALEETDWYHWKRLIFDNLNADDLFEISHYIINTFSEDGNYSHRLPKVQSYNNYLCLTIDKEQINKFII